LGMDTW